MPGRISLIFRRRRNAAGNELVTLLDAWPVGVIFQSIDPTSPSILFGGGTWIRIAQGKTIVGLDEVDVDFDTPAETGGTKTHTLSIAEIPAHNHGLPAHAHGVTDPNHNHTQNAHLHAVTDPNHNHTQNQHLHAITDPNHNHTQNAHNHGLAEGQTDGDGALVDKSNAADATPAVVTDNATATNIAAATGVTVQNTTPTNVAAATGISTQNQTPTNIAGPTGVTTQDATPVVAAEGGSGPHTIVQPYYVAYMWLRTA